MRNFRSSHTIKLLENPFDSAGAAATAHRYVELVGMGSHVCVVICRQWRACLGLREIAGNKGEVAKGVWSARGTAAVNISK